MYRQAANDYRYPPGGGTSQFAQQQHQQQQQQQHAPIQQQERLYQQGHGQGQQQQQQQQGQGQGQGQGQNQNQNQGQGVGGNQQNAGPSNGTPTVTDAQSQAASGGAAGQEMNLASVLHYLQSEWRRFERDRNEWEIERAEMRARIALLEGQRRSAENLKVDLLRRVKMLEFALRQERTKTVGTAGKSTIGLAPPSRLSILQDEDKPNKEDSASEASEDVGNERKANGSHAAMSRVSTLASRNADSPWKNVGTAPPKDPKARARSREYLKQCLQEITYLTSPGALNPLPPRAPITIDRAASPAPSASAPGQGQAGEGEERSSVTKHEPIPERPRKVLTDQPVPTNSALLGKDAGTQGEAEKEKEKAAGDGDGGAVKGSELESHKEGNNTDGNRLGLPNGKADVGSDAGTGSGTISGRSPISTVNTLRFEASRQGQAPSSPAQRSRPLPLGDADQALDESATSKPAPFSIPTDSASSQSLLNPAAVSIPDAGRSGSREDNSEHEQEPEQAQLLTAIYRPESKAAWREELRAANAQAEKARERSASLSSNASSSSALAVLSGLRLNNDEVKSDEEQLQSISLNLPVDDEQSASGKMDKVDEVGKSWTSRKVLKSHLDIVRSVAFASGPNVLLVSGGDDCTVKVWSVPGATLRHPKPNAYEVEPIITYRGHSMPVTTVLASSHLDQVFSASLDSTIRVWRLPRSDADPYAPYDAASAVQLLEGHTEAVWDLVLLPPAPALGGAGTGSASGSGSGSGSGQGQGQAKGKARLVSVSADDTLKVWDQTSAQQSSLLDDSKVQSGSTSRKWVLSRTQKLSVTPTCAAEFALEGGKVVVGFKDGRMGVVGVDEGDVRWYGETGTSQVNAVLCHPTWPVIIAGYEDGHVRIWDARAASTTPKFSILVHAAPVTSLTIPPTSPDTLLTSATDCLVRVWDLNKRTAVQDCQGHRQKAGEGVLKVTSHAEMPFVASAGADGNVRVWSDS